MLTLEKATPNFTNCEIPIKYVSVTLVLGIVLHVIYPNTLSA